ncbi:MAG TPA: LPS assembly protein LptD [Thermoanaerobaculia bacterium]
MTRSPLRIVAALLALALSAPLIAQKPTTKFKFIPGPKPGGGEVKITVGGKDHRIEAEREDYAVLEGDVHIEYQDIKLRANKVTYNPRTKDVNAEGNVIIDQGPTRLTANRAIYNLDSKTGTFFNATGAMEPAMYFSGDEIEKVDEDTYVMTNGIFTSCDLDRPAWSIHVRSARIIPDDYAHMRDVSFRTRLSPLFWTPALIWPTKSDRSQGFLIPRAVFFGDFPRLETAYFVPFGDSADATVTADLSPTGYFGGGVNIRYVPSPNIKLGDFSAFVVRDPHPELNSSTPNVIGPIFHWRFRYQHAQDNLPGGFRGVIDLEHFSDLDFFRRYEHDPRLHTLSNIYSSAYLTKNTARYSLNILSDRREIILADREQRFQQLPSFQFRMYPQHVLNTPVYFSLESSASHLMTDAFTRQLNGELQPTSNTNYFRTDFFPTLSLQVRTPLWLSLRPQISMRDTYYSAGLNPGDNPAAPQTTNDQAVNRYYAQGQVEMVGPSFSRVFNDSLGGFTRFKHVIEPRLRYIYTSNVTNQDRIIRFDTVDTPFLPIVRDSVEYSLTQRLIGKEAPAKDASGKEVPGGGSAREVMSFSLTQTVSLSKPFTNATGGSSPGSSFTPGTDNKFTPLIATLRVNPYQSITVDANANFGNVSHQIDQTSLSANLIGTGKEADKYLGLTWFATFKDPKTNSGDSSQFRINTGSWIVRDRLRGDIQVNYDAKQGNFLEQRYVLGWTGSCYGLTLAPRRYLIYDARGVHGKFAVDFGFSLKNIGTVGNVR